jgi:hypothetical protein
MKRRTILTVEKQFPYVTMRLRVMDTRETVVDTCSILTMQEMQPLEVAIETVESKTRELTAVLHSKPLNIKMLQLRLQVCLQTPLSLSLSLCVCVCVCVCLCVCVDIVGRSECIC